VTPPKKRPWAAEWPGPIRPAVRKSCRGVPVSAISGPASQRDAVRPSDPESADAEVLERLETHSVSGRPAPAAEPHAAAFAWRTWAVLVVLGAWFVCRSAARLPSERSLGDPARYGKIRDAAR
jgi:hypothetical protein